MNFTALWKYDSKTQLLSNKSGEWEFHDKKWIIPNEGKKGGKVEDSSGQVLGLKNNETGGVGTLVTLEQKEKESTDRQKWLKGKPDNEGYFTLQNPLSKKFLIGNPTTTIIAGIALKFTIYICTF